MTTVQVENSKAQEFESGVEEFFAMRRDVNFKVNEGDFWTSFVFTDDVDTSGVESFADSM